MTSLFRHSSNTSTTTTTTMLLWLLLVLFAPLVVNCQSNSILSTPQSLTFVNCPASQTTFTAVTEMVLEGRSTMLNLDERRQLTSTFQRIYNSLTQRSCDSYFRRIASLQWVNMSNDLGESLLLGQNQNQNTSTTTNNTNNSTRTRKLQVDDLNSTSVPGVSIVYEVTGTCRNCPVSRTGSFVLYDDTFRRELQEKSGIQLHMRQLTTYWQSTVTLSVDISDTLQQSNTAEFPQGQGQGQGEDQPNKATGLGNLDCQCVEGTTPTIPQPPGVQECVDEMNLAFDDIRANQQELFENLDMADLLQLDEGLDEVEAQESEAVQFDSEVEIGRGSSLGAGDITKSKASNNMQDNNNGNKEPYDATLAEAIMEEEITTEGFYPNTSSGIAISVWSLIGVSLATLDFLLLSLAL